jgi:hypothetical protein
MDTIIEAPDELETTSTAKGEDTQSTETTEKVSEVAEETVESQPEEPTFEIEGQRLTAAQVKEALEAHKNKSEWQKANTQKAQEVAEQRRLLEQESQALFLGKKLLERPDLIQAVIQPVQAKNLQAELQAVMAKRPQDPYSQEYAQWEYEKDMKLVEISEQNALVKAQQTLQTTSAAEHNRKLELSAWDDMKSKVSFDEFKEMSTWIIENLNAKNGKYPEKAFHIAFAQLYPERTVAEAKVEAAKKATDSILKAKPVSGDNGTRETTEDLSPEEKEEADLSSRIKARRR